MRRSLPAVLRALVVAAAVVACGGPPDPAPTPPTASGTWWPLREYTAAPEAHGRVDAEAAIAAGRPLRLLHGESDDLFVDPETGLPVGGFGCCFEEPNARYLDAYNAVIDAARAAGRLDGFDLRPRLVPEDVACARLAASDRTIAYDGEAAVAPGAAWRVSIEGDSPTEAALVVRRDGGADVRTLRPAPPHPLRIAFTGDGAVLLLEDGADVESFDLDRGLRLQRFRRPAR